MILILQEPACCVVKIKINEGGNIGCFSGNRIGKAANVIAFFNRKVRRIIDWVAGS